MSRKSFSPLTQLPLPYLPPPSPPPATSPPPPLPLSRYQNLLHNRLSPSILLIIIVLAIIFFVSALLHLLVRFLLKRASGDPNGSDLNSVTPMHGQLQQLFHLHDAGVDQSFIDTLPIFQYETIIGLKDPFDCAVCLCEFEGNDKLRLLPKCSHAFHVDCIDTWLLSHSTCPLCRRSLLVDNFSPNNSRGTALFILESGSESSREIASDRVEPGSNSNLGSLRENEPMARLDESVQKSEEKVVSVKLGKFKCINNEAKEGEGTSSGNKANKGNMSSRRCFSMGSYEYVMNEQTSLRVTIKPPKKKPTVKKPSRHRLAMSECDCYSRRDGFKGTVDSSRFSCAQPESTRSSISTKSRIQKKDSFSVSKIWMVPKNDHKMPISDDFKRRAISFRLPLHRPPPVGGTSPVKLLGLENKTIGSEIDWDFEEGSCNNGSSIAPSVAEEAAVQSFARRTLLWVLGRQN